MTDPTPNTYPPGMTNQRDRNALDRYRARRAKEAQRRTIWSIRNRWIRAAAAVALFPIVFTILSLLLVAGIAGGAIAGARDEAKELAPRVWQTLRGLVLAMVGEARADG